MLHVSFISNPALSLCRSQFPSLYHPIAGLSSLTWVLPDRFNDNELSLEAVHTAINLLSAFHDIIANEGPSGAPRFSAELSFALTALQQVQVLVELWGLHAESQATISSAYDPLIAVEGLK
jgi:hypothetical protein